MEVIACGLELLPIQLQTLGAQFLQVGNRTERADRRGLILAIVDKAGEGIHDNLAAVLGLQHTGRFDGNLVVCHDVFSR